MNSLRINTLSYTIKKGIQFVNGKVKITTLKKIKAYFYFNNSSVVLGSNIIVNGICKSVNIGRFNNFYSNTIFEFGHDSKFTTGDHVILSYGVLISCMKSIEIGNFVQIGEYTSVRDTTHDYNNNSNAPIMGTPDISKSIIIGNNVWVGRSCIICEGCVIEDGVIIGANSVVKGQLKKDGIYAGSPAKFIKNRISL